jgi:hypothetical protein
MGKVISKWGNPWENHQCGYFMGPRSSTSTTASLVILLGNLPDFKPTGPKQRAINLAKEISKVGNPGCHKPSMTGKQPEILVLAPQKWQFNITQPF